MGEINMEEITGVFSNRRMSLKVRRVGEAGFCPFWFCI
jgi:hypothetical protein